MLCLMLWIKWILFLGWVFGGDRVGDVPHSPQSHITLVVWALRTYGFNDMIIIDIYSYLVNHIRVNRHIFYTFPYWIATLRLFIEFGQKLICISTSQPKGRHASSSYWPNKASPIIQSRPFLNHKSKQERGFNMHENRPGSSQKRLKRICFRFCHYIYAIVNNMTRIENNINEKRVSLRVLFLYL